MPQNTIELLYLHFLISLLRRQILCPTVPGLIEDTVNVQRQKIWPSADIHVRTLKYTHGHMYVHLYMFAIDLK